MTIPWFFATITSSRILARAHSSFATVTGSRILARTARFLREVARLIFSVAIRARLFPGSSRVQRRGQKWTQCVGRRPPLILVTWASHNYRFVRVSFVEWLNTFQSPCATIPWFPVAMRDYSLVLRRDYFLVLRDIAYSQSSLVPIRFPRGSVARSPARTGCGRRAATDTGCKWLRASVHQPSPSS